MKARFVVSMLRRELRAARGRFAFYAACMAIGIAVVVCLHSLREGVREAVDLRSKELLGADLRLESRETFGPQMRAVLESLEARALGRPTRVTRLGSMALAEDSGRSRLVDLFAIDGAYPLYGEVWTEPRERWARDFQSESAQSPTDSSAGPPLREGDSGSTAGREAAPRIFVDSTLLLQLDVAVGDRIRLGELSFEIAAGVKKAPGSFGLQAEIAPRVYVHQSDLDRTGLVREGSLVSHLRYLRLPDGVAESWVEEHEVVLREARVRAQTVRGYQEDVSQAFGNLTRYLGLIGLASLVLGSIGVAAGVRVFVREKLDAVALLRSIGASPADVVAIYTGLAATLGLVSGIFGIVLCVPLFFALPGLFGALLPVEVELGIGPGGVFMGLALSIGATLLCAMGPVLDLAAVPPLRALRRDFARHETHRGVGRGASIAVVFASLLLASIWQAGDWRVGLGFALGLVVVVVLLGAAAMLLIALLRRHPPRGLAYWARQGIANLFRPRNHTLPTTIAIGFALFAVATVHIVQRNVLDQMALDTRPDRPNFVLFDVQRDQLAGVEALLERYEARITDRAPLISARLSGVSGRLRGDMLADESVPRELRWALQREYRLTYHDALRETEELVEGRWWAPGERYAEGAVYPVSLERDLAESLEVGVGDALVWRIQGVEVETRVMSIRKVDWGRMATNFFVVFPPAALEAAPQSTVLLAHLPDEHARASLQRDLVDAFPNVSALDATLILRSLDSMLRQIGVAIRLLSLFTLGTGIAILLAASLAARSERAREALLLRVLGASRPVLRKIVATEAVTLAALASIVGASLAALASWGVVVQVFELPFDPPWLDLLGLAGATFLVTALCGGLGSTTNAVASPQAALREAT